MDDDVHGGGDLLANGLQRQSDRALKHHGLQTAEHILGGVGVAGGEGAVVTGIHGLEHVQSLAAAALADDDPLRTHTKRGLDQIADRDLTHAGGVGVSRLQADQIVDALDLQLGGVLDRDDALVVRDVVGKGVEEGRLAGARAAGDEDVVLGPDQKLQLVGDLLGDRAVFDELFDRHRRL